MNADLPPFALYGYWRSSAAYRVRIGLNLKGLAWDNIPVHLLRDGGQQTQPEYRSTSPLGTVPTLEDGETGVFLLNGQAYIKQWRPSASGAKLVSFNRAYAPIPIREQDELSTFGRVLS